MTAGEAPLDALRARIARVRGRVQDACAAAGRSPDDVQLVAVTKTVAVETVHMALAAGLTVFGENRVQEAQAKIPQVEGGAWHLVGHLQRNKARAASQLFSCVQSVDSERLAERLDSVRGDRRLDVLLQVNLTGAEGQGGIEPDGLAPLARMVDRETGLALRGLMTIGPFTRDTGAVRACFRRLRELRDELRPHLPNQNFSELSMGMTDDFETGIQEGATLVRVGRAIFGDRPDTQIQKL